MGRCDHMERVPHGRLRPPIVPIRLGSAITTFCSTALERELLSSLYYYWIPIKSIQQELCLSERNVRTLLSFSCQAKSAITAKGAKSGCSATRKPAVLYATCGPAQQPAVLYATCGPAQQPAVPYATCGAFRPVGARMAKEAKSDWRACQQQLSRDDRCGRRGNEKGSTNDRTP